MDDLRNAPEPRRRGWLRKWMGLLPWAKRKRVGDMDDYLSRAASEESVRDIFNDLLPPYKKKDKETD